MCEHEKETEKVVRAATIAMKTLTSGLSKFHLTYGFFKLSYLQMKRLLTPQSMPENVSDARASAVESLDTVTSTTAPCLKYMPSLHLRLYLRVYFKYRERDRSRSVYLGGSDATS